MKNTIVNSIFNDTCTFLRTSVDTHGRFSDMIVEVGPFGGNPMHRHSAFSETFIVLEGKLGLIVSGQKMILSPGEKITVYKGQAHRFFNPTNATIKFHLQFSPGHTGAENMLRITYGLAEDGMANKKGIPKSLSVVALLCEMGDTSLTGVFSLLLPALKLLALRARQNGLEKKLLDKYCK
jgi:quercetin dioxygenase-like cupin family protein